MINTKDMELLKNILDKGSKAVPTTEDEQKT